MILAEAMINHDKVSVLCIETPLQPVRSLALKSTTRKEKCRSLITKVTRFPRGIEQLPPPVLPEFDVSSSWAGVTPSRSSQGLNSSFLCLWPSCATQDRKLAATAGSARSRFLYCQQVWAGESEAGRTKHLPGCLSHCFLLFTGLHAHPHKNSITMPRQSTPKLGNAFLPLAPVPNISFSPPTVFSSRSSSFTLYPSLALSLYARGIFLKAAGICSRSH